MSKKKCVGYVEYLGDGVNVHFDGRRSVVLANYVEADLANEIYLGPEVLKALEGYLVNLRAELKRKPAFGGQIPRYSPNDSLMSINLQDSRSI